jgi:BspA type Leucine rich repeat region (6 copies)
MEKIMILNSIGFKRLNESYFDKKIKLVLMKNTDLEYVGENCLVELENLITLSLNYNNVSRIHKKAFRDLVNLNKIEMVNNQIESLDEDLFANNVNLKLVLLYNNKLKVIPSQLFARNINLESLQLQNNAISQVEKGFHTSLKLLTRADFSQNLCISETIVVSRYVQWSNYINKFKDCFNNFALMKSTNDIIGTVQKRIDVLDEEVKEAVERVNGDMKIIEGKLENNSTFEEIKTNLLKFYKDDQETMKATYEKDLNNITSSVRRDMEKSIEAKLKDELNKSQKTSQEKLVSHDFSSFRDEFSGKFSFIYTTLFLLVCFVLAATAFIVFKMGLFPVKSYSDTRHLIQSEHC